MEFANAPATFALILANIAVSSYAFFIDRNFINQFSFQVDAVVRREQHYRVVTSSFLHVNVFHLALNVLALYFFGPTVEAELGRLGFLVVYFGAIIASGVVSAIVRRREPGYSSVGASDAVSGVILSFCVFYPLSPIYLLFLPVGVPAILFGALYIFISARLMGGSKNIIAHEGHLGGALAGVALTVAMRPDALSRIFG